jgi:nucleoside-diphosphate-sugar epimerase
MASYLVTGAAGFIGSSIVRELVGCGERVKAVDNFETGKRENIAPLLDRMEFLEIDILDFARLSKAFAGVDYVLHQAALPSVPLSVAEPLRTHTINITGTLNVLLAAREAKVKRVVYAASSSAYGETLILPKQEEMLPAPVSPYAVQKLTGEHYMRCFAKVYGLETVCLRYFNVFGPRQYPGSPYSGVMAKFITQMLKGESPTIFGDGEQSRDFTYVDNVVKANLLAANVPAAGVVGEIFNIGTGGRVSLNSTFKMLRDIIGFEGNVKYAPSRAGDVKHSQADITRAGKYLHYTADIGFEEGLRRTVEWYKMETRLSPAASAVV